MYTIYKCTIFLHVIVEIEISFHSIIFFQSSIFSRSFPQVVSYPPLSQVSLVLSELKEDLFFFTADKETQQMNGYRVVKRPSRDSLATERVWKLQFPADSERIVLTVSKSPNGKGREGGGEREREIITNSDVCISLSLLHTHRASQLPGESETGQKCSVQVSQPQSRIRGYRINRQLKM